MQRPYPLAERLFKAGLVLAVLFGLLLPPLHPLLIAIPSALLGLSLLSVYLWRCQQRHRSALRRR